MNNKIGIAYIILFTIVLGCSLGSELIEASDIKVLKTDKHPFLADHRKKLVVTLNDKSTKEALMYNDSGSGCQSSLFEEENYFILIECNGQEYFIEKSSGEITKGNWKWFQPLPANYVQTYVRSPFYEYDTVKLDIKLKDVYKFKDPG